MTENQPKPGSLSEAFKGLLPLFHKTWLRNTAVFLAIMGIYEFGVKQEQWSNASYQQFLVSQVEFYRARSARLEELDSLFLKFDVAQMSPMGNYQLLYGSGSIASVDPSQISSQIDSAREAYGRREFDRAISILARASTQLPDFPFTEFYSGVIQLSNRSERATAHFQNAHRQFSALLRVRPLNSTMRFYDAMALTFLRDSGEVATKQLFRVTENDPLWRQFTCNSTPFVTFDSTGLTSSEKSAWNEFLEAQKSIQCDTTKVGNSSSILDRKSPVPKIHWPDGYEQTKWR
jgi:hypothetical protein